MKLYDKLIEHTLTEIKKLPVTISPASDQKPWSDPGVSELVMLRDSAYELGGSGQPSVNYTLITTGGSVTEDEIWLAGPDLKDIKKDVAFARIVILETEDLGDDDEEVYNAIRGMEFVRYHVFPKGYMVRVSSRSNQEQVRISRDAIGAGISFASVGAAYIKKYREIEAVKHVRIIFLADLPELTEALVPNASKADEITKALTHIMDGLDTDCNHCQMKPVCDEVEGMKEMHFARKQRRGS